MTQSDVPAEAASGQSGQDGRRATIADVARLAEVSSATVSFVINDKHAARIRETTRQRVLAAVRELGYRPNALAKGLSVGSSRFIGVVADAIATTPFAGRCIQGAQDEAWRRGYVLLVANTDEEREVEIQALRMLLEHQVMGILYSTYYHREVEVPQDLGTHRSSWRTASPRARGCHASSPTRSRAAGPRRRCCWRPGIAGSRS